MFDPSDKYNMGSDDFRRPSYDGPTDDERADARDQRREEEDAEAAAEDEAATQLAALKATMLAAQQTALDAELAYIRALAPHAICRAEGTPPRFSPIGEDADMRLLDLDEYEDYEAECFQSPAPTPPSGWDETAPDDFDSSSPRDLF